MEVKKKRIIVPICIILVIALIAGAVFVVTKNQGSKVVVEVIPVNRLCSYDYGSYSYNEGRITSDVSQTVYLENGLAVTEVFVEMGQVVAEGTPLIQYDTTLMELDVQTKELELQNMDLKIQQTQKNINSLKAGVVPPGVTPYAAHIGNASMFAIERLALTTEIESETQIESKSESESETETESESESESASNPEEEFIKVLDKDTDLSGYPVNEKGEIEIPCDMDTKLTPGFINRLRTPVSQDQNGTPVYLKVRLVIKDGDRLLLDGAKLAEPFMNTKSEFSLRELYSNDKKYPVDDITVLDKSFFETYPEANNANKTLYIKCSSQVMIAPEFICMLIGRNSDGSLNRGGASQVAVLTYTEDTEGLTLDGKVLPLPHVTSVNTTAEELRANGYELNEEPVETLDKDTALDPSKEFREVYEIYCNDETVITKDFINRIRNEKITVVLKIDGYPSWVTIDGGKLEEPTEKSVDTPMFEFVANGCKLNEKQDDDDSGIIDGGGVGPTYTAEEIKKMLTNQELSLAQLQTQKKQAQLDLGKLKEKLDNATVMATITGIVTTMGTLDGSANAYDPFIVVSNTEGLYLSGSINELNLGQITPGQSVTAMSWMSGSEFTATIREISPYPSDDYYSGGYNPNSSNYPFIAYIDNPEGLSENEYVEIYFGGNPYNDNPEDMGNIYIHKAFVGTENDGRSYIYIANADNKLEKRYVTTGKLLWSTYLEITNGAVTEMDMIAFPYGKDVKDGVNTKLTTEERYY